MHLLLYNILLLFIFDPYIIFAQSPPLSRKVNNENQLSLTKSSNSNTAINSNDNLKTEDKLLGKNDVKVDEKITSHLENGAKGTSEEVLGLSEGSLPSPKHFDKINNKSAGLDIGKDEKSSIVPRKGAIDLPESMSTLKNSSNNRSPQENQDSQKTTISNISAENKLSTNIQSSKKSTPEIINKKPESASDFTSEDADRFSFIESSTTGKDYVMTGIAIFICIWAVIFGALFFYKRAGELWDRRHYRRMDFLVEGMYND